MTTTALLVHSRPKPGKEADLAALLSGAQPPGVAELGTVTWFAARLPRRSWPTPTSC